MCGWKKNETISFQFIISTTSKDVNKIRKKETVKDVFNRGSLKNSIQENFLFSNGQSRQFVALTRCLFLLTPSLKN